MAIQPDSIPYVPNQTPQAFQPASGAAAMLAAQKMQLTPTPLTGMQQGTQTMQQGLQDYLQSQQQGIQRQQLAQQAPLVKAQTQQAQTQTQQLMRQIQEQYGPSTGSISGTSLGTPPPGGDQSSDQTGSQPYPPMLGMGGIGRQSPVGIDNTGFSSVTGQPMSMAPGMGQGSQPSPHIAGFAQFKAQQQGQPGMGGQMGQGAQGLTDPNAFVGSQGSMAYTRQAQESAFQAEAKLLSNSSQFKSVFGNAKPEDILPMLRGSGQPGTLTKGLMELAGTQNKLGYENQKFTIDQQNKAKQTAATLQDQATSTQADYNTAKQALAQAQKNPAVFNDAVLAVGKTLGVTSRNPRLALEAISQGDPSVGGQISEFISKKGGGQMTPQLIQGLNQMLDNNQQSKASSFESQMNAHAQRNAQAFGGDVNQSKAQLFPGYQWGGHNAAPPNQGAGATGAVVTVRTSDGKTQPIYAANLAAAKQRDPGLQLVQQ